MSHFGLAHKGYIFTALNESTGNYISYSTHLPIGQLLHDYTAGGRDFYEKEKVL